MDRNVLKRVIFDQRELIKNIDIVERDIELETQANYILVGLRRSGKSWLLYKRVKDLIKQGVEWDQIIYINFDDERLSQFKLADFEDIMIVANKLTDKKKYFYFDEIQNIDGWEKFARRLADEKYKVDITGSNAKMLSSEMNVKLGGRYISKEIMPYSFNEYLKAKAHNLKDFSTNNQAKLSNLLHDYLTFGGFPECVDFKNKREYVSSIYQKVLFGDIVIHNSIRNVNGAKLLIEKIAESVKNDISYSRLHNCILSVGYNLSKDMVIDYCNYCISSFLIFKIHNYYDGFVDKESNPKYYFVDNGLLNLFLDNKEPVSLENIVAIALYRKYKDELYYLKGNKLDLNIDFYLSKHNLVIQVCYELNTKSNDREIGSILKHAKETKNKTKYLIVTNNQTKKIKIGKIEIDVVPISKFLIDVINKI